MNLPLNTPIVSLFVKCLESLPNLHTLEVAQADEVVKDPLKNALARVRLPQIKTLILSPAAHPLLRHCHDVEDLVCVYQHVAISSDSVLGSLASNLDSKIKRLVIPLISWVNPSRFVTACPRLTELTIIYPHAGGVKYSEGGYLLNPVESARTATIELVNACKTLPAFDTLQIVHFPLVVPFMIHGSAPVYSNRDPRAEQLKRPLREHVRGAKDSAIDCLKKPGAGCREGEGRIKKTTVRVVEVDADRPRWNFYLDSVKVEECEVWGFGIIS